MSATATTSSKPCIQHHVSHTLGLFLDFRSDMIVFHSDRSFQVFVVPGIGRKMAFKRQVEQSFLHFFAIFDDFSKFHSILHFEKSSNMAKNWQEMKKSFVQINLSSQR